MLWPNNTILVRLTINFEEFNFLPTIYCFNKAFPNILAGNQDRPYLTVQPLAADLGLTIDHSCARDDSSCVKNAVSNYKGSGNILICWEHTALSNLAKALGDNNAPSYSDNL